MIKKFFYSLLLALLVNKIIIKFKKWVLINNQLDFKRFDFENSEEIKKIFFAKKYINRKYYDQNSINYHNFNWINFARNIGGADIIALTKKHILNWKIKKYTFFSYAWKIEIISKRLINLIYNYDFYSVTANKKEKNDINELIYTHFFALLIYKKISKELTNRSIEILKSILLIELIQNRDPLKTINLISEHIYQSLNKQGIHNSLNPCEHAEYINNLYEIKSILLFFNQEPSKEIDFQLLNMSAALKNCFHNDGTIALFNGSNNSNIDVIKKIINLSGDIKPKNIINPDNGLIILNFKKIKFFFDVAKPNNRLISENIHAGTLSFEISYDKEKIITNCGYFEKRIGSKPEYLRYSAAHSTITLNNTNISELIEKKSYRRIPSKVSLSFDENDEYFSWESAHDGYSKNFNKIIKRKILISKNEFKIVGNDTVISTRINKKQYLVTARFHLTPVCSALMTSKKSSVLIKTNNNNSFIFESDNKVSLEESIYINNGKRIEKTRQIVISSYTSSPKKNIKWSISRITK